MWDSFQNNSVAWPYDSGIVTTFENLYLDYKFGVFLFIFGYHMLIS